MKTFAAALAPLALLAACSGADTASTASGDDRFAGLDQQISAWRTDIEATNPSCATKVDGAGCESFQVTCKAERTITPEEQAQGVTAKLVSAMTFTGKGAEGRPGSAFATFSKAGDAWTRTEAPSVNLTTCAG
ncbi:hypothetical protein [Phenylobacterium sp. J367]|uniref:hypothetical protein n=1 Tax=Phenylobacterium sp. J367 TaxID=2898435 RepID=UPI00215076A4|nr:hypothetical protein [Phenylobacterium sp. J367]MCR5878279.1 hypothetical protein [Phenylobacterium sp. J367]